MKFHLICAVSMLALMGTGTIVADITMQPTDSYNTVLQPAGWSPAYKAYALSNTSYDYVYWQASDLAGKVTCQPPAGWIPPGATKYVALSPAAGMNMAAAGTYTDQVRLDLVPRMPGDATGDGTVNAFDMQMLTTAWNSKLGDPKYNPACDFNGDTSVNVFDLQLMAQHWNRAYGSTTL